MSSWIAAVVCAFGILGLFLLDRDRKARTSWALWLPTAWLLICGSRPVSSWLQMAPIGSPEQYLEGSPIDRTVYSLLIAAGIIVLLGRHAAVARIVRKNWPIVLFVLYCAISVMWSDYPGVALKRWIKSLGDYTMILILLTDRDRMQAVKQVFARVGVVVLPLSIIFIKYYPDLGRAYAAHWDATQFFVGVALDKNMLGMICMVFGFVAFWRVIQALRGPRRDRARLFIVHGTLLVLAIRLLLVSNSMTSLSCFGLTCVLVGATSFLKVMRKRLVLNLAVATTVLITASVLLFNLGGGALQAMGRDPTLTGRTYIWEALLRTPINPVFGTGFESFWLGERLDRLWTIPIVTGINEAHNGYLEVYLNLGWLGVALFAALIATGYRNVLRALDREPEAGRLRLGFFVIAVIYNLTEAAIRSTDLVWIAFLLVAIALPELPRAGNLVANLANVRTTMEEAGQSRDTALV
jgi:exopolysaccharide production protein ExoQ